MGKVIAAILVLAAITPDAGFSWVDAVCVPSLIFLVQSLKEENNV